MMRAAWYHINPNQFKHQGYALVQKHDFNTLNEVSANFKSNLCALQVSHVKLMSYDPVLNSDTKAVMAFLIGGVS